MSSRMISVKIHKPSISFFKSNRIYEKEKTIHNYLISKYSRFEYSYSLVCINNLIFNEQCRIVARFKDFLILDDMTEFLRRFYTKKELKNRLNKIFNFYESYSKIFPNYMILAENKYLYKNIRKKQKVIDAFNQIKKEEEENRKSLKKEDKGEVVIFDENIQESINRYRPSGASFLFSSIISGFMKNNTSTNNDSNWNSLISISMNHPNPINYKLMNSKNKNEINKQNSDSFEQEINEVTLNSENSLVNVIQLLNKKYDNNYTDNSNNKIGQLYINNNNKFNYNDQMNNNHRVININNEKTNENKTIINKDTINKKVNQLNMMNDNITKNKKIEKDKYNNDNCNISTPPKIISPVHKQLVKRHNHQKSALNNNKKFISHKQAVSVSNNNGNNTIKIINNINNIIINDANINKEMVININTNYFELNNTNLNSLNKINNNNINVNMDMNKKHKNILFKKIKINSKSKSKNKDNSINKQEEALLSKKISNNYEQTNFINKTLEEKKINPYNNQILNFENQHYCTNSNNIENSNIINNNVINIHNSTASHISNSKNNKSKLKKNNNFDIKTIRGIVEYRSIDINNIGNNGTTSNNNKNIYNHIKKEINKKAITIDVENYEKNKKSQNKQRKKLEILYGTDAKKTANKQIFNKKILNKKTFNILNTDGNVNYNIYSNTTNNYYNNCYNSTDINDNSHIININNKNEFTAIKNGQIRSKLNKKIMPGKQKTYSLQINNKNKNNFFSSFNNNNKISKELNSLKRNKMIGNNNLINEHVKNYTQVNLDSENQNVRKISAYNDRKEISEKKYNKISAKEMKEKYHKFIMGNKIIHGSYDTSNRLHIFKKFTSLYNNTNANSNTINNITDIPNKKTLDIKSPYKFNIINTPASKLMNNVSNIKSINMTGNSYKNYEKSSYKAKMPFHKKEGTLTYNKNKHLLYKVNGLKNHILICDTNNKKMKYIKK